MHVERSNSAPVENVAATRSTLTQPFTSCTGWTRRGSPESWGAAADGRSGCSSHTSAPSAFNASAGQITAQPAGALALGTQPAVDGTPGRRPAAHEGKACDERACDAIGHDDAGRGPASSLRSSQAHAAGSRVDGARAALSEPQSDPGWTFYLGTHEVSWLTNEVGPLFISHRRLALRKRLPRAATRWALDSGGFSELELHGRWVTTPTEYIDATRQYVSEIGMLDWAAPMDWMCEPKMLARTGLTVEDHQRRTITNFLNPRARPRATLYPGHTGMDASGLRAVRHPLRSRRGESQPRGTGRRWLGLSPARHAGGRRNHLGTCRRRLVTSWFWSEGARDCERRRCPHVRRFDGVVLPRSAGRALPGCQHQRCSNCIRYAERWRTRLLAQVYPQLRLNLGGLV